jgi:phosphatidylserine decarboxylase
VYSDATIGNGRAEIAFAPVDGVVIGVDARTRVITVYVSPTDSHVIFSPTDGLVTDTREERGLWIRPGTFRVPDQTKTGRLTIRMRTPAGNVYEYWIEVGHGRYITDTISLTAGRGSKLLARERIGEIVIGSLYEMHMLVDADARNTPVKLLVQLDQKVIGGKTEIAVFDSQ